MIYSNPDFFIARSPLIPFKDLFDTSLTAILNNKVFLEGLFLASPELSDQIAQAIQKNELESNHKLILAIYKYWLRASFRCTPFGTFAGITKGTFSERTEIELSGYEKYKKHSRFDTHFLSFYTYRLLEDDEIKNAIKWYSNNTRYKVLDKIRYIKFVNNKGSRIHNLVSVSNSDYLDNILEIANEGVRLTEIISTLVKDDIEYEEAKDFVEELIDEKLLISEFEPFATGPEFHHQIENKIDQLAIDTHHSKLLSKSISVLNDSNNEKLGNSIGRYQDLLESLANEKLRFENGKVIQCDLLKPAEIFTLNNQIKEELIHVIEFLNKIQSLSTQTNIIKFKEEFIKRYEDNEVPLLEVLDPETGLSYPANSQSNADNTPLLDDILFKPEKRLKVPVENDEWTIFLFKKVEDSLRKNNIEIEITDKEINEFFPVKDKSELLPDSLFTMCSILGQDCNQIDNGNYLVDYAYSSGPSMVDLISRFCYTDKEVMDNAMKAIEEEERRHPDKIFAEILFIPEQRLGNILIRPKLRNHEIPFITRSSQDPDNQIELKDLLVSVRNNKVVLWSKKLKKEVIPRLSNAHNFSLNSLPHYHFLCDTQFQNENNILAWEWGILRYFSFLPRIRYKNTILSKAIWKIQLEHLGFEKHSGEEEIAASLETYFKSNRIPHQVTLVFGDNKLPIDIRKPYCQSIVAQEIKKYGNATLNECLFNDNNLLVKGPEGSFTNELVIPWVKNVKVNNNNQSSKRINFKKESSTPDFDWYYVKLYCGVKIADKVLVEVIKPLVDQLIHEGKIGKFFFIRYADPDNHLRIRFQCKQETITEISNLLNCKIKDYLDNNLIWKVQTDTYKPEIFRYGYKNLNNSESLFFHDSMAVLSILSLLDGDEGDDLRWILAIKGIDLMLNAFGLELEAKKDLIGEISQSFLREFNANNRDMLKQLSNKFRKSRKIIYQVLSNDEDYVDQLSPIWKIYDSWSQQLVSCINTINELDQKNLLNVNRHGLYASYIHMHLNRFLRSKQRIQEMVLYDLLHQHYKSILFKNTYKK